MTPIALGERLGTGPSDGGAVSLGELDTNPYPTYARLRETGVTWVEAIDRWAVTRWEDIARVEMSPELFSSMERDSLQTRVMGRTMLRTDGDAHRRLRRAAQEPLAPNAVSSRWLPELQRVADELIDGFAARGSADLIAEFAAPFAARTLAIVLGIEQADQADMQVWSQALMDGTANYADNPATWARSEKAASEIDAVVRETLDAPGGPAPGSIIAAMCNSDGMGRKLAEDEIRANVKLIIGGGLNEPRDGIGILLWALLTHPEQARLVLAGSDLWLPATEEALRWISPLAMYPRQAAQPITLGGCDLEPGARLAIVVGAANRDEREWERPDEFDVLRPRKRNVAFGLGHHFCLGVWLARHQIGSVAGPTLFARLPGLRLDLDDPPDLRGWVFRGFTRLPLRWDPA